ncbi:hypothetical protein MCC93_08740 [Morococcus cerebrosus]|uniref:Uncharacterized protein n=2 Tax=Neisseriaceae TaxID=481 RepID=A0A0C1GT93_9NEIS|nr:hypothetical protein MCC93_08740 [Morococcus cerebrosus]
MKLPLQLKRSSEKRFQTTSFLSDKTLCFSVTIRAYYNDRQFEETR